MTITTEEISDMNYLEKCRSLNGDSVTTCQFFDNRFHEFIKKVYSLKLSHSGKL